MKGLEDKMTGLVEQTEKVKQEQQELFKKVEVNENQIRVLMGRP